MGFLKNSLTLLLSNPADGTYVMHQTVAIPNPPCPSCVGYSTEFAVSAGRWECQDCKKRFFSEASTYGVAKVLEDAGRLGEAEALYRESLAMTRVDRYRTASDVVTCLDFLAALLEKLHRPAEAEPLYRESMELRRGISSNKTSAYVADGLEKLARVLGATHRYDEAEALYRADLHISRQSRNRYCITESLERLILLLKKKRLAGYRVEGIKALEVEYVAKSDFISPEGFVRITRGNHTDIYLVRNQELFYLKVSEAFELDDSGLADRSSGRPFTLNDGEDVEFLGTPEDYFIPKAPLWNLLPELVRIAPKNCGMLPLVRAGEQLMLLPAEDRAAQTTAVLGASLADYRRRRG